MANRIDAEIQAARIESMQAKIPNLPEADALILSQALFFLPADDERQPERAFGIAEHVFYNFDLELDDVTHSMLFAWLTNTVSGAAQARLDKLANQ